MIRSRNKSILVFSAYFLWLIFSPLRIVQAQNFTWSVLRVSKNAELVAASFLNADQGLVVGNDPTRAKELPGGHYFEWVSADKSYLWITINGGKSFRRLHVPTHHLTSIHAVSSSIYLLASEHGLFRSLNSGHTWKRVWKNETSNLRFQDRMNGFATIQSAVNSILRKTTDGGLTWSVVPVPYKWAVVADDVAVRDTNTILVNVSAKMLLKQHLWKHGSLLTRNGGQTWSYVDTLGSYRVLYLGNNRWTSNVSESTDDGNHWHWLKDTIRYAKCGPYQFARVRSGEDISSLDGISWKQESDLRRSKLRLHGIVGAGDNNVYAFGDDGVVLKGSLKAEPQ